MSRRRQAKRASVEDIRVILRLTIVENLSVRAVSDRLKNSKACVLWYFLRAQEAGMPNSP